MSITALSADKKNKFTKGLIILAFAEKYVGKKGQVSYKIRVEVGYKLVDGKRRRDVRNTTWRPEPDMTERQIEKELERQKVIFEDAVKQGIVSADSNSYFKDVAAKFIESKEFSPKTLDRYKSLLLRINISIGNIRISKLKHYHLERFYKNLEEQNVKAIGSYAVSTNLGGIANKMEMSRNSFSKFTGISTTTASSVLNGKRVSLDTANKVSAALNMKSFDLFEIHKETTGLSKNTILHYHQLISAIINFAEKKGILPINVIIKQTEKPKVPYKEAVYLDDSEAKNIVNLLFSEGDIRKKTIIFLGLYTGARRAELCGLEWEDFDFINNTIKINRGSQYISGLGIVEVGVKNETSRRMIYMPESLKVVLLQYREWWEELKNRAGDEWNGEKNRLFVQSKKRRIGLPINPDTVNYWVKKFIERNNLNKFTPHSLRHSFISILISTKTDIKTVLSLGGYASYDAMLKIYAHKIDSAKIKGMKKLDNVLHSETN